MFLYIILLYILLINFLLLFICILVAYDTDNLSIPKKVFTLTIK